MSVTNVLIFCADALRRDHLPPEVRDSGEYVDTISAGTTTPNSFSSIVSGLYPTQHQAFSFTHRLDPQYNLLNHLEDEFEVGFHEFNDSGVADVLGMEYSDDNPIDDAEPPFFLLEREINSHAPYDRSHEDADHENAPSFYDSAVIDWEWLRGEYQKGCERVGRRFFDRIDTLESRGLLDETLVVFTSDHGELLGEYSEFSHSDPVVPELVELPTVFLHPDDRQPVADLMSHVDIVPTILDCLDRERPWNGPGQSVYEHASDRKVTEFVSAPHSLEEWSLQDYYEYRVRGVWDRNGGYAFNQTGVGGRAIHAVRQAPLFNPLRGRDAIRAFSALYHHLSSERTFGDPDFTADEARETLAAIDEMEIELGRTTEELSGTTKEQLERLGYL